LKKKNDFSTSRYARFFSLPEISREQMEAIRNTRVSIIGIGGLGSVTAHQLCILGVKYLRIIDNDLVEKTNLQRQFLFREKDCGDFKVKVAKKFLKSLNPDVEIEAISDKITTKNSSLVTTDVDFIVDGLDNFETRFIINDDCLQKGIPYLFGAANGFYGNVKTVIKGDGPCLRCLFGYVNNSKLPSLEETGIHPSILNIIGNIQVVEATRIMIGQQPALLKEMLFCDLLSYSFDILPIKPQPNCLCQK
jgi:molybdopterin/thiamine biosynthesis adenylyltransferase